MPKICKSSFRVSNFVGRLNNTFLKKLVLSGKTFPLLVFTKLEAFLLKEGSVLKYGTRKEKIWTRILTKGSDSSSSAINLPKLVHRGRSIHIYRFISCYLSVHAMIFSGWVVDLLWRFEVEFDDLQKIEATETLTENDQLSKALARLGRRRTSPVV